MTEARLGLRANAGQFALLIGVNGLVGALVGQERALVPLLGEEVFGVEAATTVLAFIAAFGAAKAVANLAAGVSSDRRGRKPVLIAGWLAGLPVPFILIWAPTWAWVVFANLLLGVNQGLAWSATVIMKIDLAGPKRRGLAMGINEFVGYGAVAASAWISGLIAARYGLRPQPFLLGIAIVGLGLGLSVLAVRETQGHADTEAGLDRESVMSGRPRIHLMEMLALVSYRDRGLAAVSRTGMINNANDALAWGVIPLVLLGQGFSTAQIATVAAVYPAVWGAAQLGTGALSDRIGRRLPIALGMWVQALALGWFWLGGNYPMRVGAAALLGIGTALVYPTFAAAVSDLSSPAWRASAVGGYRLWRDLGYLFGAIVAGLVADIAGSYSPAIAVLAILTALAGADAWVNLSTLDARSGGGKTRLKR